MEQLQQSAAETIAALDLPAFAAVCTRAVRDAKTRNAAAFTPYVGREMFNVVFATYEPARQISAMRGFVIGLNEQAEPTLIRTFEGQIEATGKRDYWAFGETDYLNREVLGADGRQYFSQGTRRFLNTSAPLAKLPSNRPKRSL
jgi:hypothetical protein